MRSVKSSISRGSSIVCVMVVLAMALAAGGVAEAANGQAVILGQDNSSTDPTSVTTTNAPALVVQSDSNAITAEGGAGLGVHALGDTGVLGVGGTYGVEGYSTTGTGVWGLTYDNAKTGVYGSNLAQSSSGGSGVVGYASDNIGVSAISANGTALAVSGVASFSRSGKTTVPTGASKVTVPNIKLSNGSMILAVVQVTGAPPVKAAVPNVAGSSFTIYLAKATTKNVVVAWFVLN